MKNSATTIITETGTTIDKMDRVVEVMSSAILTGTLAVPPVAAVTAGRIAADFTACTPPEISSPKASARIGLISVTTLVLAAKAIAPAVGRMKDCMMTSLMLLITGNLSTRNSISDKITSKLIIHQLARASQGELSVIRSVKRAIRAMTNKGIYAFKPALAESPNAENIPNKDSIIFPLNICC